MSKFSCKCGHIISDSEVPNEVTGNILSDKSGELFFDEITTLIDECLKYVGDNKLELWRKKHFNEMYPDDISISGMLHDLIHSKFMHLTLAAIECENCGRLWVQNSVEENEYREYCPGAKDKIKVLGLNEKK